jgi:integrase/recombinase XerD
MNSKQSARYIKRRMGNDLKQKILVQNGIISEQEMEKKPSILNCPRCSLVNAIENKYCSKCTYPLVPSAFDEIKEAENRKIQQIQEKYEQDMKGMREQMNQIISMIQYNPKLSNIKTEVLLNKKTSE